LVAARYTPEAVEKKKKEEGLRSKVNTTRERGMPEQQTGEKELGRRIWGTSAVGGILGKKVGRVS